MNPATGAIAGSPTTGGTYTVTITATDSAGFQGSTSFTWQVDDTVTVTSPGDQTSRVGASILPVTVVGADSLVHRPPDVVGHRAAERSHHRTDQRDHQRDAVHSGAYAVTVDRHRQRPAPTARRRSPGTPSRLDHGIPPATGPGAGGTKVSITGSDLVGATSVVFGTVPATRFTVNTHGTKITAYAPAESAGTVDIVVTTPQGPTLPTTADRYTFTGPVVTGLGKTSGPATGGTKVLISGTGLTGATVVRLRVGRRHHVHRQQGGDQAHGL